MRALVIENAHTIPCDIEAFLYDNKDLFNSINHLLQARSYPQQEIAEKILHADAIVVSSTFIHINQLESITEFLVYSFLDAYTDREFRCYIHDAARFCNWWDTMSLQDLMRFENPDRFKQNIHRMVQRGMVYEFSESVNKPKVFDPDFPRTNAVGQRNYYEAAKIRYSEEFKGFYPENEDPRIYIW